jgi:DNA primase
MARICKQELYRLRNEIRIDRLIADLLSMPSKTIDGRFRFCCPLCNAYDTAVKPETNLARCFSCKKNFNTIDLTMLIKKLDFVDSVSFLRQCLSAGRDPALQCRVTRSSQKAPVDIGEVLSSVIPQLKPNESIDADKTLSERLLSLEKKVEQLTRRLNQISDLLK